MKNKILLFSVLIMIFSSCISSKKLKYLQDKGNAVVDAEGFSLLNRGDYNIRVNDILNVNISSFDNQAIKIFGSNIGSKDNRINVSEASVYIQGRSVDLEGNIELPVIGILNVEGMTTREVKSLLNKKLSKIFKEGTYYVRVQLAGVQYSILGEVSRRGRYKIYKNQVNILEAIANAGGLNITADRNKIKIIREYPEGIKEFYLDLTDNSIVNSELYFIQPNDIILVNPLKQKSIGTGTTGVGTFSTIMSVITGGITTYLLIDRVK